MSTDYTVKVRTPGGTWTDLDEYQTRIGAPSRASNASFVYFDTSGPVELSVTYNLAAVSTVKVRPSAQGITPAISGNTATFTISGPMKLVVDVNDNVDQDLMIFANPLETDVPSASDPNVIYYGPGFYDIGDITVPSGKTLYIAGGAVIKGGVVANNVSDVTIRGRGILYKPADKGVEVHYSTNVTVDGIIVNDFGNANTGGYGVDLGVSDNVFVNNVKLLAYTKWTDGVDEMASNNINVNDCYIRTGDDSIAVYGSRDPYFGSASVFNVTNSILMPGKAHPVNVGTHGNPDDPDTISGITISNVDILTHNPLYGGALPISITASDSNLVKDVLLTDIRWEDVLVGKFLDVITYKNPGYGLSVGRGIDGVTVKNFSYNGTLQYDNNIYGYDATRMTQNVAFENLKVNGSVVTSAADGRFVIGSYTDNITFSAASGSPVQSGHVYKLQNAKSGKVLGIKSMSTAAGAPALQWSDNGTADHEWTFTQLSNGNYELTNVNSGKVLGVYNMSTADGAQALQWSDNGTLDHEWQLVTSANGTYKLVNRYSSKALGIKDGSTAEGALAVQWLDNGTLDQSWNLVFVR
ncbi:RICIN domain-containing protein [Streptomyces sp. NPDC057257]|uniref:RICIN domain-containing protein n=1 Tax=Streptomyces sp. NPDC057257 TaxID=3346071 RepID=UPI00362CDD13